ncbi:MAG: hypothetical protein HYS09_08415 [Chloroflexi bacterium]|nr:hypothetical protein [Chloroflexota bacterium]
MSDIDTLQDLRDVTIVAFTIAGTVMFLLSIIAALIAITVLLYARAALSNLNKTVRGNLQPTLEDLRESVENIRGASAFVAEHAVTPVIRVYSIFAGLRRFLRVLSGVMRRFRRAEGG